LEKLARVGAAGRGGATVLAPDVCWGSGSGKNGARHALLRIALAGRFALAGYIDQKRAHCSKEERSAGVARGLKEGAPNGLDWMFVGGALALAVEGEACVIQLLKSESSSNPGGNGIGAPFGLRKRKKAPRGGAFACSATRQARIAPRLQPTKSPARFPGQAQFLSFYFPTNLIW
jgi:hypothetical protein